MARLHVALLVVVAFAAASCLARTSVPSAFVAWGNGAKSNVISQEVKSTREAIALACDGKPEVEVLFLASSMRFDRFAEVAPELNVLKSLKESASFSLELPYTLNTGESALDVIEKRVSNSANHLVLGESPSSALTPNCRLSELDSRLRMNKMFENDVCDSVIVFLPSIEFDSSVEEIIGTVVNAVEAASKGKNYVFMLTSVKNEFEQIPQALPRSHQKRELSEAQLAAAQAQFQEMAIEPSLYVSRWPAFALEAFLVCALLGFFGLVGVYSMASIQTQRKFETPHRHTVHKG